MNQDQANISAGGPARLAITCATAGLLLLVAACATHSTRQSDEAVVRAFAAKGYAPVEHDPITTTSQVWMVSGQNVKVVLAEPVRSGAWPVVIYLPGLGEPSESGQRWRAAWAGAGYAVLSIQLLDEDATAWRSDLARTGEFKTLGLQRYAGAVMRRRVLLLADLIAEGRRRTAAGEAVGSQLDWNRLAVAGFDLGAYTALTVAGEHVRGAEDAVGRVVVRAAIIVSPYASFADGAFDTRYRDIRAPVLSVTSDIDGDALGLVDGPHLREAPFTQMGGPDKYLLSLHGLSHTVLGGGTEAPGRSLNSDSMASSQASAGSSGGDDSSPQRRSGKRAASGEGARPSRGRDGEGGGAAGLSPTTLQMRLVAAQGVSTAFLDAYLKDDAVARQWLTSNAKGWLGSMGELRLK
jgi:dienelactone hydrolase